MTDARKTRNMSHHSPKKGQGRDSSVFDPVELLERPAALTPRPRINLVLYYGVLGARSAWRFPLGGRETARPGEPGGESAARPDAAVAARGSPLASNLRWAQLIQRSVGFDVLACPGAADGSLLIALIEEARVVQPIPGHLGLPTKVPAVRASRGAAAVGEGGTQVVGRHRMLNL
jgi:hypothetical protein